MPSVPERIQDFNRGREPRALQEKYRLMAENPFRFFRGTSHLYFEDLANEWPFGPAPMVWNCGDLHLENFGSYRGDNGLTYFDLSDFDEVVRAPLFIDLSRLVTSLLVAASGNGFAEQETLELCTTLIGSYSQTLRGGKPLVVEAATARGIIGRQLRRVAGRSDKALIRERTTGRGDQRLLAHGPRALMLTPEARDRICTEFNRSILQQARYTAADAVFRIAGTGSIGISRYLLLLKHLREKHYLLIDVKEALPASLLRWKPFEQPRWTSEAERIVSVQRQMQHMPLPFLSSFGFDGGSFVVRALQPTADKIGLGEAAERLRHTSAYAHTLGLLTASAQLRAGGRYGSATADELVGFGYEENWTGALLDWCRHAAGRVSEQYGLFCEARQEGFFDR